MRRISTLALIFVSAAVTLHADRSRGAWHITHRDNGRLQFQLTSDHSNNSSSIDASAFTGLTPSQIGARSETPVDFRLVRDAGTLHFTGTFIDGDGVGRYTFAPNHSFAETLRASGVAARELDDDNLFSLAMFDVSSAFIHEMQSLGYKVDLDQYIAFRIHGVSPEFVRGMRDLGVRALSDDNLVALRIHGATVDFVRELATLGYKNLDADDLVAMRIHGVTASYIRQLRDAGYSNVPVEKLVAMRIHGIDADFARHAH